MRPSIANPPDRWAHAVREAVAKVTEPDEKAHLRIEAEMSGVDDDFESPEAFVEGVAALDLARVKISIYSSTYAPTYGRGAVQVFLGSTGPGAILNVSGEDRVWVEGTLPILREELKPLSVHPRSLREVAAVVAPALALAFSSSAVDNRAVALTMNAVGTLVTVGLIFSVSGLAGRLMPTFRLLPDSREVPSARRRRLVRTGGFTLLTIVVTAIVSALASRWLG